MFRINNENNRQWRRPSDFIVNFEHIPHLFLVFYTVDFEQVKVS